MWGVAGVHTTFKFLCVALLGPFYKQLAKLATLIVKEKKEEGDATALLDERLLNTPSVAVARATDVTCQMAEVSTAALLKSLQLFENFDPKLADEVRNLEDKADQLEDALGSYLVQVSACDLDAKDSRQITKLLHIIGDYERISDHAVNVVESAEELRDKKLSFSAAAQKELGVLSAALQEVLTAAEAACIKGDLELAAKVEPLEQIIDELMNKIKLGHILRLQKNECTIELGFVLNDLITNLERVSDHCSNIAGCVMEVAEHGAMDMHKFLRGIRRDSEEYKAMVQEYSKKYAL
jgi:phosphate:Na+ symporter